MHAGHQPITFFVAWDALIGLLELTHSVVFQSFVYSFSWCEWIGAAVGDTNKHFYILIF